MGYWITVVDDEPLSLTNAKLLLRAHNMRVSCLRSGRDLMDFVKDHTPDLILLDILMPDMDGFETYHTLRRFEEDNGRNQVPVIFLTGEDNNETERRGLKAGASDFIHKPFDEDILVKRINNTIANSKKIESLTEEASVDRLTGFLNKTSGTEKVTALCRNSTGALMIMDLDNFKLVNDLFGHDMGDRILVAFADIVRHNVRSDDVICRIGGDEFMAFFPNMNGEEAVAALTNRLNEQLLAEADRLMGSDHGISLGISIGVALVTEEMNDHQILFQYADNSLYEVKRGGKHGYLIYDPDPSRDEAADNLENDLSRVIQLMSERGGGRGAMLLGQEAFTWNYRYIERSVVRHSESVTKILFSLSSEESGIIFSEMVSEFGKVLVKTFRKIDIILQWRQNRYFVVLPQLREKDAPSVLRRVMDRWKEQGYHDRVKVDYAISFMAGGDD